MREGILKGVYLLPAEWQAAARVQLLGAGAILGEALAAQRMLKEDWDIDAAVWSVTSFAELQRDGMEAERLSRLGDADVMPYVAQALCASRGPAIAATDYVRAVPALIRAYVPRRYVTLGTDGFGHSDTRRASRSFFEVDRESIVIAALKALADEREIGADVVRAPRERYRKTAGAGDAPWQR
ncbi:hypothetical protein WL76_25975 [Burkholderia ubonensis]|nr:hypothetical protein WL76_25975 [Burkholderia ubonensis]